MLVSTPRATPLLPPLTPVLIDQRISCQNPGHRFLNNAIQSLPYTQFAVINAVLHKHKGALRFSILPWRIKRFYTRCYTRLAIIIFGLIYPFAKLYPHQTFLLYGIKLFLNVSKHSKIYHSKCDITRLLPFMIIVSG